MTDAVARGVRAVLTDIDDTLTDDGRLHAATYAALESLHMAGLAVVPVTGRPAGWCDLIARQWPIDGVVGENGAFWFRYDDRNHRMTRRYLRPDSQWRRDRDALGIIADRVLAEIPRARLSADQGYRAVDVAIDFAEDVVPPLSRDDVGRIVDAFEREGATAKVSSIHVNAWFGEHDKLTASLDFVERVLGFDGRRERDAVVFVGDSPNDAPMFGFFPQAVGVANVREFAEQMTALPGYVTTRRSGGGFVEFAEALLARRRS